MKAKLLLAIVVSILFFSMYAQGVYAHGGNPNLIHACKKTTGAIIVLSNPSTNCTATQGTPLDWPLKIRVSPHTFNINCPAQTISSFLNNTAVDSFLPLIPGDKLSVTGSCVENITVRQDVSRLTLDGGGAANGVGGATIAPSDSNSATINVNGTGITIQGFDISGPSGNGNGISITREAEARVANNNIHGAQDCGIFVTENSSARIGFLTGNDTLASPNSIHNNGSGVCVTRSSDARIVGNGISNNTLNGVFVSKVSHADLTSNTFDSNGAGNLSCGNDCNGISLLDNSGVNLGSNTPGTIFDDPNSTNALSKNVQFGIRCVLNSYVRGHVGTLDGATSTKGGGTTPNTFSGSCIDSTTVP